MENRIKAIIVEDVKKFHQVIETFVEEVAPHVEIVAKATTLQEGGELIRHHAPQLVFLDIQFDAEGKTAFDLLRNLSEQNMLDFQIIIISAFRYADYYEEAYHYGALHFLTKPIDKQKLKIAIGRVTANVQNQNKNQILSQFLQFHEQMHSVKAPNRLMIEGLNFTEIILMDNIVYFEACGRYTEIFLINSRTKSICSSSNIGEYERRLASHPEFFRFHRNLIINTHYILRFSKKDRSLLLPEPFPKKYASKERFKEFLKLVESIYEMG